MIETLNEHFEPFYIWKERYCIEHGIYVIDGIAIINKFIKSKDAVLLTYSLN